MEFLLDYHDNYWISLKSFIINDIGVAALMGNLEIESACIPYRLQGDPLTPNGYIGSITYTNQIDNGMYSENQFINDNKGYGVAQWTYVTRKLKLYQMYKSSYDSIGDFNLSIAMLKTELSISYPDVLNILQNSNDLRAASDYVLHNYEQPEDQSEQAEQLRWQYALFFYNQYSGRAPIAAYRKMPLWMYLKRR